MYEIIKPGQSYLTPTPLGRTAKRTVKSVIEQGQADYVEQRIDEHLTADAIDGVSRLDALRVMKARTNEANALMFELEAGYAQRRARKLGNRGTPLGGL